MSMPENKEEQEARLTLAGISLEPKQLKHYLESEDCLSTVEKGAEVTVGYKRCGACGIEKKFHLFNKNAGSKTHTSGSCKECQKKNAAKSYGKTKAKRNYKAYYQANKEAKQAHARRYYSENKEELKVKHAEYLRTSKGQRVMKKAHAKRRSTLANNKGVPYTRMLVIERDGLFQKLVSPVCYLCNTLIEDISGAGLHIDHVIPVVQGGLDCFTNVACTHALCNLQREKDARELQTEQVDTIMAIAQEFMDEFPEKFK